MYVLSREEVYNLRFGKSVKLTVIDMERNKENVAIGKVLRIKSGELRMVGYVRGVDKIRPITVDLTEAGIIFRFENTKIFGKKNRVITKILNEEYKRVNKDRLT